MQRFRDSITLIFSFVIIRIIIIIVDDEEAVVLACTGLVFCALDFHQSQEQLLEK